jgi:uncharacterized protein DUF2252
MMTTSGTSTSASSGTPRAQRRIAAYLGRAAVFEEAAIYFSEIYADQNERDYNVLVDAVRTGDSRRRRSRGHPR